jgi:4-alpha-glucanotransferase
VIFPRSSGILLHVTSLPGAHGIGDFGRSTREFVEFLDASGQKIWQVLPLSPTGYGDSPYQCFSAFAGNPFLIDLEALRDEGLLSTADLANTPKFPHEVVAYDRVIAFKQELLQRAARTFFADGAGDDRQRFDIFGWMTMHSSWLARRCTTTWLGFTGTSAYVNGTPQR